MPICLLPRSLVLPPLPSATDCGTQQQPLHRKTFYRNWNKATEEAGLPGFHFHDLRHTGNTLATATGASTKELMSRMGYASPRAALIYQHATKDRDAAIPAALSKLIVKGAPRPGLRKKVPVEKLPAQQDAKESRTAS